MELNDGYYDGIIVSVVPIKSRFGQEGVLELQFECGYYDDKKQPAGKCEIYLELSNRYGMGMTPPRCGGRSPRKNSKSSVGRANWI